MIDKLSNLLFQTTTIELEQLQNSEFVHDLPNDTMTKIDGQIELTSRYFFNNREIYVSKHNRFAAYPAHSHQFLELNYIYSGSCSQVINGERIDLFAGDLVLIDAGTVHSISPLGQQDILINILFRNQDIRVDLLDKLKTSNSMLFDFLLNASTKNKNDAHPYLLFRSDEQSSVSSIIEEIMLEYFFPRQFSKDIISGYLPILFIYLVRNYQQTLVKESRSEIRDPLVAEILDEINNHWSTTSLEKLAAKLSYNRYYLSNLIKKKTGRTFTELLNHQKLLQAQILITSTKLPISEIIHQTGFSNKNYFYTKYQQQFNELPSQTRKVQN